MTRATEHGARRPRPPLLPHLALAAAGCLAWAWAQAAPPEAGTMDPAPPPAASAPAPGGATTGPGADLTQALAEQRRALARDPDDPVLVNGLGLLLAAQGQAGEAEAAYRRAIALFPGWGGPAINLAVQLSGQGRHAEAEALLQSLDGRSLGVPPHRVKHALGQVYLAMDRPGQAEPVLRAALALAPDYYPARVSLALALLDLGRPADASTELATAEGQDPNKEMLYFLCQLYAYQHRADETLGCLAQVRAAGLAAGDLGREPLFRFLAGRPEFDCLRTPAAAGGAGTCEGG